MEDNQTKIENDMFAMLDDENSTEPEMEGADEGELIVVSHEDVVLEKNDRSLSEFNRWYKTGRLIVDPQWQRMYVWDRKRASKLIESFLRDIPVPVIYLAKNPENKYEVIDGLQRLTSVFDFFDNRFPLSGLELVPDLNGQFFKDLPAHFQSKLEDATLRTFELSPKTQKDLMFVIFERLNTGGIALNDMEIRNCLYRGKLNDLIKRLAEDDDFKSCLNQRGISKRMADRNLILRFLAFYEKTYQKARYGLKKFLNEFFEIYRNPTEDKLGEFEKQFKKSMKASVTIFGDQAFRLRRDSQKGGGEWATRVNATVFQTLSVSFTNYDIGQLTRRADAIREEYIDLISTDDKWLEYVKMATGEQARIEYVFTTWMERLKLAIADEEPNDSQRLFSRALKEEMFRQSQTCAICNQHIPLLSDAALDHDIHYWRGGKTVPENARLVHRLCNLKRSASL